MRRRGSLAAALAMLLAGPAHAQGAASPMSAQAPPGQTESGMRMGGAASEAPSTTAYKAAMARMEHGMATPYTGDADRDFVAGMLPHHEGAVGMAEVELRYGTDPALKGLARRIVAAQRREIAFMRRWQAEHPAR